MFVLKLTVFFYFYLFLDTKLVEEKVDDDEVTKIALKVTMAKRMAEIVNKLSSFSQLFVRVIQNYSSTNPFFRE